uniref:Centriolar and ciliogenesis-associated protein HYLS1 C-terminal domain-containing protein n=1 Tax=Clastoptera arizonana TaxID=38151 RepID=A0A1B6DBD7_9HEMI
MDIELDPNEVLAHLNQMGYHNITPLQLREFIKDLKKLILYEQRELEANRNLSSTDSSSSQSLRNIPCNEGHTQMFNRQHKDGNKTKDADAYSESSDFSIQNNKLIEDTAPHQSYPIESKRTALHSKENIYNQHPKSSFIKPRNLTRQRPGLTAKRSDPVLLFHHYRQLWKQQKLPGEEPHSDLRWAIRNKMMGPNLQARNIVIAVVIVIVYNKV